MKAKQLIILSSLLAVAIIVALSLSGNKDKVIEGAVNVGDRIFEDLPVNDITAVAITGDEESVELERSGEKWVVKSRGGYPADFSKLSRVLKNLKELKVADTMRAGESAYGRLELKDPAGEKDEKAGTLVEFKKDGGAEVAKLVLGKNVPTASGSAAGMRGETPRYMRFPSNKDQVFIVPKTFRELVPTPSDWLVRDFFRIQKPKSTVVTHPEGEVFKFSREKEGGDLTMEGLSENEELNTANSNTIGSPFSSASFRDVAVGDDAKPETTGLDKAVKVDVETFDGFKYLVTIGKGAGDNANSDAQNATITAANYYLTVEVSADLPEARVPQDDEKVAEDASDEDKKKAEDLKAQRDSEFEAAQKTLKEKLENETAFVGTVYKIDSWAAEKFFKKRDELVKEKEKEEAAEPGTPPISLTPTNPQDEKPRVVATTPPISVADALEAAKKKAAEAKEATEGALNTEAAPTEETPAETTKEPSPPAAEETGEALKAAEETPDADEGAADAPGEAADAADEVGGAQEETDAADEAADEVDKPEGETDAPASEPVEGE